MRKIYMDHSATTPVDGAVLQEMLPFFREKFGNASSVHQFGQEAKAAVEEARETIAGFLGASAGEIYFVSGGTEADNWALQGVAMALKNKGNHIITSQIEHHAVLHTCQALETMGFKITYLKPDATGRISPEQVEEAITRKTILISIMHANNELGTLNPVVAIGEVARRHGVLFHTDAVQSVGKVRIDLSRWPVDLLSASAHKLYGPKGVGLLFIRKGTPIRPLFYGGGHERNLRAGTQNVPGVVGFGKAVQICDKVLEEEANRLEQLREALWNGIRENIADVRQNGHPTERLPGILNVSFAEVAADSLLISLDMKGIAASSGSACSSGAVEPSHVLRAIGLPEELQQSTLRFSLGRSNTEEDIQYVVDSLVESVERLRAMSSGG